MAQPLKDRFDSDAVESLAEGFASVVPGFNVDTFVVGLELNLPSLELKERIALTSDAIAAALPRDYSQALDAVVAVSGLVDGFEAWPLCTFVERHGLDHPEASLDAMATLTQSWSCEFAVRPYLRSHLALTRRYLRAWTNHPEDEVRRLPSEGTRPLLPWAPRVPVLLDDPEIGLEVLNALRRDPSEIVRRSVANHLNDLAKSRPALVVDTVDGWLHEPESVSMPMVRHALRGLVKCGNPSALRVLGFTTDTNVCVTSFSCDPANVVLGDHIELSAQIQSTGPERQRLVVDFAIHHLNASGASTPKVFKWTILDMKPGEAATIAKRRKIATASTRRYHPGYHRIDLLIAGEAVAESGFILNESSE